MEIELARLFVKVIQFGSFTKAAEAMQIPKSTVSKGISRLEKQTGTKLLLRTTRSLSLTAAGQVFYETCFGPIQTLEEASKHLYGQDQVLAGKIRITAPEDIGTGIISYVVADLVKEFPLLNFELNYTDAVIDLVKDGYDLAVRIGKVSESRLRQKKLGEVILSLVASPDYLKNHPKISAPNDLEKHSCLTISGGFLKWSLRSKKETRHIKLNTRIVANQMTGILKMATAGAGIALAPLYLCQEELAKGTLAPVLPDWQSMGFTVTMLSPVPFSSSARLRITSERIAIKIQEALAGKRKQFG